MYIIFTNKFDTSIFKLATEFTIFSSSTTSHIILKYQHLGKFETFLIACYINYQCSFEILVLSVVVRTKLVTNRTLCHFILIWYLTVPTTNQTSNIHQTYIVGSFRYVSCPSSNNFNSFQEHTLHDNIQRRYIQKKKN